MQEMAQKHQVIQEWGEKVGKYPSWQQNIEDRTSVIPWAPESVAPRPLKSTLGDSGLPGAQGFSQLLHIMMTPTCSGRLIQCPFEMENAWNGKPHP